MQRTQERKGTVISTDIPKNYWKLGTDRAGNDMWMEKPRMAPNGYWEVAMVYHFDKGSRPGKGTAIFCSVMANEILTAQSAFEDVIDESIRYKFIELMRAIILSARYAWTMHRGNTGLSTVPGEAEVLNSGIGPGKESERTRIDSVVIPGLVKLVDALFAPPSRKGHPVQGGARKLTVQPKRK